MRVHMAGAMTRLLLALVLVAGLLLSSLPSSSISPGAPANPATTQAKGKQQHTQKHAKGAKHAKKQGKGNSKDKAKKQGKSGKNRRVPKALDAEAIAAQNADAVAAYECDGLEAIQVAGRTYCTHGNDAQVVDSGSAALAEVAAAAPSRATARAACLDDGVSGPRIQMIYVHANDQPDRLGQLLPNLRRLASEMDGIVDQSARKTGDPLRIRFVTDGQCQVDIPSFAVNHAGISGFGDMIRQLKDAGYDKMDRKYLLMVDANAFCGVGSFLKDDNPTTDAHDFTGYARIDTPCWDPGTMIHELSHTLGAVQYSAPNTSKGAHCIDEWDVMCYSDEPFKPKMRDVCSDGLQEFRLDCNDNDYFAAIPAPGSYLSNHWNTARSIYFAQGSGETCVDIAAEPDDAYWYSYWEVPMPKTDVGTTVQRAFCAEPGDTDWLVFKGEKGASYQVETSNLALDVDTQLVVYRGFEEQGWSGMDKVRVNDNRAPDDPSSLLAFTAPATGSYLIGISEAGKRAGFDKTYDVTITPAVAPEGRNLALSRSKLKTGGKFTATMHGLEPQASVEFWLRNGESTTSLGTSTADSSGAASGLLSIPKGAGTGSREVEAIGSDGSFASAKLQVSDKGGKKNKGGPKKNQGKKNKHPRRN